MKVYVLLMVVAMAVTLLCTPVLRRLALSYQVLTPLRERDVHVVPTPRLGGVAIATGFEIAVMVGYAIPYLRPLYDDSVIWAVACGVAAICTLGIIDDIWDLDWMTKMVGQILITAIMAMKGVQLISFPIFGVTIGSSRLSLIVSVILMVAIINAVNFIDGLDGLAAGIIAIGGLSFFFYSYILARQFGAASYATVAAVIVIALAGCCLGFLWYNFHPASIFMGDSGAMVLGLIMSSAAIIVTGQINPAQLTDSVSLAGFLPIIVPIAVVLIPTLDLVITSVNRMLHGKSPFAADRTHLHHRLLVRGHSHRGVVMIMWTWTAYFCLSALSLMLVPLWATGVWMVIAGIGVVWISGVQFPRTRTTRPGPGTPDGTRLIDDGIEVIARQARRMYRLKETTGKEQGASEQSGSKRGTSGQDTNKQGTSALDTSEKLDINGESVSRKPPEAKITVQLEGGEKNAKESLDRQDSSDSSDSSRKDFGDQN